MKHLYRIIAIIFVFGSVLSCDPDKGNDTDYLNDREISIFFNDDSATLFVEDGAPNTYTITVASTALAESSFDYTISVDPSSTAVEGVDFQITSSTLSFEKDKIVSSFTILADFDNSSTDGKTAIFNLGSNSDGIKVAGANQFALDLFKLCPFDGLDNLNYMANVYAFDEEAPSHNVTLVPVPGTTNQWTIATTWGPTFVTWATGNSAYDNRFLYSGTIIINPDFTVTIVGDASWATGGSGEFSPCTQIFSFTLNQGLFTSPFTTDVVLTPM